MFLQLRFAMRIYGLPDFEANRPGFGISGERGDHAGKVETPLLWALDPDCVDISRLPSEGERGLVEHNFEVGPNAFESSRRSGERMAEDEARWLREKVETLLHEYQQDPPRNRIPLLFMAVEQIWTRDVEPQPKEFLTMKELFEGRQRDVQQRRIIAHESGLLVGAKDVFVELFREGFQSSHVRVVREIYHLYLVLHAV